MTVSKTTLRKYRHRCFNLGSNEASDYELLPELDSGFDDFTIDDVIAELPSKPEGWSDDWEARL